MSALKKFGVVLCALVASNFAAANQSALADMPSSKAIEENVQQSLKEFSESKNTDRGITLKYPKSWDKASVPAGSPLVCKFLTFSGLASFRIAVDQLPADVSLDEYVKVSESQIAKVMVANSMPMKRVTSEEATVGGSPATKAIYTMTVEGTPDKAKVLQYFIVVKNRGYVFNFTADSTMYDAYMPVMDQVVQSIQFN
ncbi:MAG TPA: hypothetical protein V6C76_12295 [Drouetiella sp.]